MFDDIGGTGTANVGHVHSAYTSLAQRADSRKGNFSARRRTKKK